MTCDTKHPARKEKKCATGHSPTPTHVDGRESVNTGCRVWQDSF